MILGAIDARRRRQLDATWSSTDPSVCEPWYTYKSSKVHIHIHGFAQCMCTQAHIQWAKTHSLLHRYTYTRRKRGTHTRVHLNVAKTHSLFHSTEPACGAGGARAASTPTLAPPICFVNISISRSTAGEGRRSASVGCRCTGFSWNSTADEATATILSSALMAAFIAAEILGPHDSPLQVCALFS
jgi:hypothetical protein